MKNTIILILLFFTFNCFGQKEYSVIAKDGLSIRDQPSIKSNRICKLSFKEKVKIIEKTDSLFITEKIKGYWVKVKTKDLKEGYVFNGFLKPYTENNIIYTLNRSDEVIYRELKAKINGEEIILIGYNDESCFEIVETQDYNNDGYEEVLLESNACGGNCCGNSLFIFSFNGEKFVQSDYIGNYFGGMILNYDKNNTRHFIVDINNVGVGNTTLCEDKEETYIFDNFNFKLIDSKSDTKLEAIIELKSSDFISEPYDNYLSINFDLDNNGVMDKITADYWEAWGILNDCKIILNGKALKNDVIGHPKRIGILDSKTNNVSDLVIECNKILIWNGFNYEEK